MPQAEELCWAWFYTYDAGQVSGHVIVRDDDNSAARALQAIT